MPIYANIGGAQKQLSAVYANIGGAQKQLSSMLANIGGASKEPLAQPKRVLLTTIITSGTFTPSSFPSIGNKYDIIAVGGGGGGGSGVRGGTLCGGGGASGDTIAVNNLTISSNVSVTIGAGGKGGGGTSASPGLVGYETVFGSYVTARGGDYGRNGASGSHGSGGRGALTQVIRKLQETAGKMVDMQQALIMAVTAEIVNTEPEAPEEQKKFNTNRGHNRNNRRRWRRRKHQYNGRIRITRICGRRRACLCLWLCIAIIRS